MPVSEDKMRNPETLHRWFAVSSVLMTLSILWMIQVDYQRPWRDFQDHYYLAKATFSHLEYLDAIREEKIDQIDVAKQRLADAETLFQQTAITKRDELKKELEDADLKFRKSDIPWSRASQVLEVTRDTYERTLEEKGIDHRSTIAAHEQFLQEEENVDVLRKEKEHWEDRKNSLAKQIRNLQKPVDDASKRLGELEKVAVDALQKDMQFRGVLDDKGLLGGIPIVKGLINFPLLDFISPKNTPSRHQVNQLVLYDVKQRLNYLESYTTDRCTTCHVSIDDPEFSKGKLARKLERSLPAINEALGRLGKRPYDLPAPPVLNGRSDASLTAGHVTEHWDELTKDQQDDYFDILIGFVNQYLELTGRKTIELGQPLLAHPDLDLYVTVNSIHPMAKIGCTVCHEGNPQETDFVLAAHSPPTHKVEEEWVDKYYVRRLGLPVATFELIEHYWDRPMRLPKYTEAGCAKCHSQIEDIARFKGVSKGSKINLGKHLFVNVGCVNCHNEDTLPNARRVGPDLTHVASKLKPEFIEQWIHAPQTFRPSTLMPHFFLQENNRDESANAFDSNPEFRTETEVAAMAKFLFSVSQAWSPIPKPDHVIGDAQRGRELFKQIGCVACHANMTEFGEEWITQDLIHREGVDKERAMHRYKGMTYDQKVQYAMVNFNNERDTFLHPDKTRFNPDQKYNTPTFNRFAPELSGIGSKVTFDWLYSWLMDPTHYAKETKMPRLRLTQSEAADIATYLRTLENDAFVQKKFEMTEKRREMVDELIFGLLTAQRSERRSLAIIQDEGSELSNMLVSLLENSMGGHQNAYDLIRPMTLENKKLLFLGSKMISHYGCFTCHEIAGFENATPPGTNLSGWAEKPVSQLDFAFYGHAFHGMREEREEVFGYVYPREAHELNHLSPIPDDTREEITHTHAAFAKHKMLNPRIWDRNKLKRPYDKLKMPNFYFTEEEAEALTTFLLSRIPPRVSDSLSVDYENSTMGPIARGRSLTRELNCIACHEIEDNTPTIQQYYRRDLGGELVFDEINSPPLLRGEGAKVQHNWLHRFFQDVVPLRPWLQVRMPSFNLTVEQATILVEYFAALSRDDSAKLSTYVAKIDEHIEGEKKKNQSSTSINPFAGADWYTKDNLEDATDSLRLFGVERKLVRKSDIDTLTLQPDQLRDAHVDLLKRVRFIKDLYDVKYPFVEPAAALSPTDRFDRGMRFLNDMGCLKCHVLGDMLPGPARNTDEFVQMYRLDGVRGEGDTATAILNNISYPVGSVIDGHTLVSAKNIFYETGDVETSAVIEGPGPNGELERIALQAASAPNLTLTYERLRRAWVYAWMLEPALMQPGTKMPQNFSGGVSPFADDPNYPGDSNDHINLLVDTLFDAGRKHVRFPLLKIIQAEESEDFDDEEGAEEDFDDD